MLIAASIYPLADWVREVGGPYVEVATLLKPGTNPHTYEPTPDDGMLVADARGLVYVGLGLEEWIQKLAQAAGKGPEQMLQLGRTVSPAELIQDDPHVWLDPVLAAEMVKHLAQWLAELDPSHAWHYRAAGDGYAGRLRSLLDECRQALAGVKMKRVVTYHRAFSYLFRRCGVELVGAVEQQHGREPSSAHVAALIRRMQSEGISVVFSQPQFSDKAARVIARELGGRVVVLDPLGDPADPQRDTYIDLMRFNINQIRRVLQWQSEARQQRWSGESSSSTSGGVAR